MGSAPYIQDLILPRVKRTKHVRFHEICHMPPSMIGATLILERQKEASCTIPPNPSASK
jgi:hypothetical protein